MTMLLGAWLAMTLAFAAVALLAVWSRRDTHARLLAVLALGLAAPVSFWAILAGLSFPDTNPPPGKYQVLGARIDVDEAIYVLLNPTEGEPRYYRIPYTTKGAGDLQGAIDASEGGGKAGAEVGEGGEAMFYPPPVTESAPKQAETPIIGGL